MRVANIILNDFPMGSAKKLGVTNKNLSISPIGLLIMTRSLIFIWQKCHGVGNFDWVLYLAVKSSVLTLRMAKLGFIETPICEEGEDRFLSY